MRARGYLRELFSGSLRKRLLLLALLPLLVMVPLLVLILASWGAVYFDRLLIGKVRSDLAVANGYFEQVKESVGGRIEALAASEQLAQALRTGSSDASKTLMRQARQDLGIDYLVLLDAAGVVRAAADGPPQGSLFSPTTLGIDKLPAGRGETRVDVLSAAALATLEPALAQRALTPLITTRKALATTQTEETRGMVVQTVAPVAAGAAGALADTAPLWLVGGLLLNKNLAFVDRLNEIVYPEGALPLGSSGTATLFLDDVRIATNVRLFEGERAIGTRVSAQVRQRVLERGSTWLDRAFVVNDWYVSAYEPILDRRGQRVGMLYVGFLEAPFQHARWVALGLVAGLFLLAAGIAVAVSLRLARTISAPVERMHGVMNALESGHDDERVGRLDAAIELAELGAHFDRLLDRLAVQTDVLQRWGAELDGKVAERTHELAAANEALRSAQQRLVATEKMAAIGQLAAGVAHEVNNPVAVIQGNLEVLREILGDKADPVMQEIRLIQDQVFRIRLIVTKLLQFARPTEFAGFVEPVQFDQVVQDSLVLVAHQTRKTSARVVKELHSASTVLMNRNELQQVLINLVVNALQAMGPKEGGVLRFVTGDAPRDGNPGAFISVADNGPGIAPADRARLFDPFFTTKTHDDAGGTGLGLWVSQGLIQRYGGRIEVDSPPEGGSAFTVWLPLEPARPDGL
jgi:two-component system NtrC family sensor kinase